MIIIRLSLLSINSSAPSTTYMRQWTKSALVQVMACHRFGANPSPEQCWLVANWILRNEFQWNMNPHAKLFIHENAFQNVVCEMAAILSRGDELRTDTKTKAKQGKALVEIFGWPDKGLFFFQKYTYMGGPIECILWYNPGGDWTCCHHLPRDASATCRRHV